MDDPQAVIVIHRASAALILGLLFHLPLSSDASGQVQAEVPPTLQIGGSVSVGLAPSDDVAPYTSLEPAASLRGVGFRRETTGDQRDVALVRGTALSAPDESSGSNRTVERAPAGSTSSASSTSVHDDKYVVTTFVGEIGYRWPYREMALYRPTPALRYNRVDGFVLGLRRRPLPWDSYEHARPYGQLGYAFHSKRWQVELGAEVRIGQRYGEEKFDLKFGGSYRRLTTTNDVWKTSWLENSLAAFFFNYDFFDYFETEGWGLHVAAKFSEFVQATVGFRSDKYRTLEQVTSWSLFGGSSFRFNPPIDEGRMQSIVFTFEGGRLSGYHTLPKGFVFRMETEIGKGLGGDFAFNRFIGDVRGYVRSSSKTSVGLRLRGGGTGSDAPAQKLFTLGGIGSVRGYPQNAFVGTRMLLGNAELIIGDFTVLRIFRGLQLVGFVEAGWTNQFSDTFDVGDVFPSAGVALGLFDRDVRLDLAFPLSDMGGTRDPSLWLRITPSF
jgi:hypothetical protein